MKKKSEGLSVTLSSPDEVGALIRGREHWIFAFGRNHTWLIDEVDKAVDVWPSSPTLLMPVTMTLVPKAVFSRERLEAWLAEMGIPTGVGDEDIVLLCDDHEEGIQLAKAITLMANA